MGLYERQECMATSIRRECAVNKSVLRYDILQYSLNSAISVPTGDIT
jgi:hypothetical protein